MSRSQLSLVGGFVIGGLLLFAVGIFMIGDRRLLFAEQFQVSADFGNVNGIQVGTRVRVGGFDAGEVTGIGLPASPAGRFTVRMRVREDLHSLVRGDSVAAVLTDGLLGNVFIQLREGSEAVPPVEPGGQIRGIDAIEIADLITEGRDTFRILASEFIELRQDFGQTVNLLDDTVQTTTLLLNDVGNDVRVTSTMSALFMDEARGVMADTRGLVADVRSGQGTLGQLLTDDALYRHATGIAREMERTIAAARETTEEATQMLADFREPNGASQQIMNDVREVLGDARDAMSDLAENTEALKRNWLFRGFFNDRGFFNLDAMTVAEYRALSESDAYRPLRLWLAADGLFTVTADGGEELSDEGRQRLDSAMAEFLRYPRNSPLVVEGYATTGTRSEQYLKADRRAALARSYLVDVFGRVTSLTGTMPIGADALGSPTENDTWDGVALTLFVRPEALRAVNQAEADEN